MVKFYKTHVGDYNIKTILLKEMEVKMNKKKIIIPAAVLLLAALCTAVGFFISRNAAKRNSANQTFSESLEQTDNKESESANAAQAQNDNKEYASAEFKAVNSWNTDNTQNIQYELTVTNLCGSMIDDWKIIFPAGTNTVLEQSWNCSITTSSGDLGVQFELVPAEYNRSIAQGQSTQGIGFIIAMTEPYTLSDYRLEVTVAGITTEASSAAAAEVNGGQDGENLDNSYNYNTNTQQNNTETYEDNNFTQTASGGLRVSGTGLVDESGNRVQLRGVSTHGLAWYPEYVNKEAFMTLRDDWGANTVRLAMYTNEYGGYCSGGDRERLKELINDGVMYATELGMYVIIDWHILSDGNPQTYKNDALEFFEEMASKYVGYSNVIYEICNEPNYSDWNSQIKPYAQEIVSCIRKYTDALIIVGTNTWSQDVDDVIDSRLDDGNVMYALHFYAGTHKEYVRNKMITALDAGVPVFVSECSICEGSGNGGIDYNSAEEWLNLLNSRGVSFIAWNLSNKNETSALIQPGCTKLSGWTQDDLSETGKWFKNAIGS